MIDNDIDQSRFKIVIAVLIVISLFLTSGLVWLQAINGEEFAQDAARNSIRKLPIPAPRGEILDSGGSVLVNNVSGFVVTLAYMGEEENKAVIEKLAAIFIEQKLQEEFAKVSPNVLEEELIYESFEQFSNENKERLLNELILEMEELAAEKRYYRRYEPIKLAPVRGRTIKEVPLKIVSQIEEMRAELPNVIIEIQPERQYKLGNQAFHVLGSVHPVDRIGRYGLELSYDKYLAGSDGVRYVKVNAVGKPIETLGTEEPVPGSDIYLSIDKELQLVAEQALQDALAERNRRAIKDALSKGKPAPENGDLPHSGAAVVVDVKTGAILAMASAPEWERDTFFTTAYDANDSFVKRFLPGFNHALGVPKPSGSILKPIIAIAALEEEAIDEDSTFFCDGVYNGLNGNWRSFTPKCWNASGHGGPLTIVDGLKHSCNLVFYPLGEMLGLDTIAEYFTKFGIGQPVGLEDLSYTYVDEDGVEQRGWANRVSKGQVVTSEEFEEIFNMPPQPADKAIAGIGQGETRSTPLQIAMYTAMLANAHPDGNGNYIAQRLRPYLVEKAIDREGKTVYEAEPEVMDEVVIDGKALELTREGMRQVTESSSGVGGVGTAYWLFHPGGKPALPFEVAGKTGTAQEVGYSNHGWFISYAPYDDPEIAVAVLVEQGLSGGASGAPVTIDIYKHYFGVEEPGSGEPTS